eukprot:CAMPEP_0185039326 /NCGR_PEP_ID=MMETSP1103-20130426/36076_1 /TAXON_ID=36769 /ORGANISM="Paraphysomonas bandaiensis, Strain Caron Lab Isolate" /LENGTH=639 /DNA_ID=CAMNT_0027578173 /DNA_START=377 /DNA_END=2296 /DNA_ORIENTATION=-
MTEFINLNSQSNNCHSEAKVRSRSWQRLLVGSDQQEDAKKRMLNFLSIRCQYRSLSPCLIQAALLQHDYQIQMVMECQRLSDHKYSSTHLLSHDPPIWSAGTANLTSDPRTFPVQELQEVIATVFNRANGWDTLHEFIFTLYPNKDEMGWEYNQDFDQRESWTSAPSRVSCVRRRIWMRTCVRDSKLYECRQALREYIDNHPRGICRSGAVERQSKYRKRWTEGLAVLTDTHLEITLDNNYQSRVVHSLRGCEAVVIEGESTGALVVEQRKYRFGLRQLGPGGKDEGVVCVLNARSIRDRDAWIAALAHQTALVNLIYWPLVIGPPTADQVIIKGEMWKQGHLVPNWKFRSFELRRDGTLAYSKDGVIKGKLRLRGCEVQDADCTDGEHAFKIVKRSGYWLALRTHNAETKQKWVTAIREHISGAGCDDEALLGEVGLYTPIDHTEEMYGSYRRNSTDRNSLRKSAKNINEPEVISKYNSDSCEAMQLGRVDIFCGSPHSPRSSSRRVSAGPGVPLQITQPFTHTHDIKTDTASGRRCCILDAHVLSTAREEGVWEADDENDDGDGDSLPRVSSFNHMAPQVHSLGSVFEPECGSEEVSVAVDDRRLTTDIMCDKIGLADGNSSRTICDEKIDEKDVQS